ncbi:hypothetical protein [Brevundimonas sp.]|uniref:hypothetical protein n=1 Tax=Brevundimonas sp. TaxID=1871086 RepID=UPI002FC8AB6C
MGVVMVMSIMGVRRMTVIRVIVGRRLVVTGVHVVGVVPVIGVVAVVVMTVRVCGRPGMRLVAVDIADRRRVVVVTVPGVVAVVVVRLVLVAHLDPVPPAAVRGLSAAKPV